MKNQKIDIIDIEKQGEIKIPKSVLEKLPFSPKGRFLLLYGRDFVTLKKIEKPSPGEIFRTVADEVQKQVRTQKISKKVIKEAIEWARKRS